MKVFLKILGIAMLVVVLFCIWWVLDRTGTLDTRFWTSDPSIHTEAANGAYVCPVDLAPGNYILEIRSKGAGGTVDTYNSYDDYKNHKDGEYTFIRGGSDFHFSIAEGQVIDLHVSEPGQMRFKKIS